MSNQIAVSIVAAADMLGLSERYIRNAVNAQELPARKVGRNIRIEVTDLTDWFRRQPAVGGADE